MDWTNIISMLIQTVAILGAVGASVLRLRLDVHLVLQQQAQVKERIVEMEKEVKDLSKAVIDIAKQDIRLNNLEARVQEISSRLFAHTKSEGLG